MTVTAEQLIDAARDEHAAFSEARHPNAGLLRQLRRYHKRLSAKITNVNSSILSVPVVIDLTTFDFDLGFAFTPHLYVLPDGEVEPTNEVDRADRSKFYLIGQNVRLFSRPMLSGWFIQNQFFLQGAAKDWTGFVNLHMQFVAIPTSPTALTSNFDPIPDSVEDVLITFLARFMAGKGHMDATLPPIDAGLFLAGHAQAETEFLQELGERKKARKIRTLDVFPAGP